MVQILVLPIIVCGMFLCHLTLTRMSQVWRASSVKKVPALTLKIQYCFLLNGHPPAIIYSMVGIANFSWSITVLYTMLQCLQTPEVGHLLKVSSLEEKQPTFYSITIHYYISSIRMYTTNNSIFVILCHC